ncbi:Lrp/AsnC family transcriptional regulator [Haloprofundus salinisoli]|uniref:Lrp/AsnC family transcriptional regulator n=1 Tax=Haloprofundus salinisoli TaxID=2876193 RepID=UPI001CCE7F49|nr:Lrp/AsnC family transcriptional regulator [Haloprofundus salinisoli]
MNAELDGLDRQILHLLQVDARGKSDTSIAAETGVTSTTVANRIQKLEERKIIRGYHPDIDYEAAGYPLVVFFVCTAPIAERSKVAESILGMLGIVSVREIMAGNENLHIQAVADSTARIESMIEQLTDRGVEIGQSYLVARELVQPWDHFHPEGLEEEDVS